MVAKTTSLAFPSMFDVSRNRVQVLTDNVSIVNRSRLLMLTEPTELYNELEFGVGLRRYIWQYNTENTKAIIKERIVKQLDRFEPCVEASKTAFADGLLFTGGNDPNLSSAQEFNQLKMTVGLRTKYGDTVQVKVD